MTIEASVFFSALSNDVRLRCILLLQKRGELCVCELTHALELSQPMISRHLAMLRDIGIVIVRRDAQWVYYSINPLLDRWMKDVLQTVSAATNKQTQFAGDLRALKTMPVTKKGGRCA